MKAFIIILVLMVSGCSDLGAEITGEKYTIRLPGGYYYKVNDYHIRQTTGVITFTYYGTEYKSNTWVVKTTKND